MWWSLEHPAQHDKKSPVFQAESEDVRRVLIPLLLTLMYVLTKVRWTRVKVIHVRLGGKVTILKGIKR